MRTVSDIMTRPVITLERDDSLQLVRDILHLDRLRHFPVIDNGIVVGVVSQRDLYKASLGAVLQYGEKAQQAFLQSIAVREVMSEPPITITPQVTVQEAARLMMERKIGCLPVVDGSRLVGIVSETDMLKLITEMA